MKIEIMILELKFIFIVCLKNLSVEKVKVLNLFSKLIDFLARIQTD